MDLPLLLIALLPVVILLITIVAGALLRGNRHSLELLASWAEQNGYEIIRAKRRYLFTGPFPQVTSRGAQVYRVDVEVSPGRRRSGWVLCGSGFWGTDPNKTTVRWDK
jgi:hypothetical protein